MAYKVINEELGLYSCRLGDLTMEYVESFLKQWNDSASIATLTLFSDKENRVILNEDNKYYETYLDLAQSYLEANEEQRANFREAISSLSIKDAVVVLDEVISRRKNANELEILEKQIDSEAYGFAPSMMDEVIMRYGKCGIRWLMHMTFLYGVMQGKREERARRKKTA